MFHIFDTKDELIQMRKKYKEAYAIRSRTGKGAEYFNYKLLHLSCSTGTKNCSVCSYPGKLGKSMTKGKGKNKNKRNIFVYN